MLRRLLVPLVAVLLLAAPAPARADELTLEQMEEAREKYADGNTFFQKGNFVQAEASFRRCYELMKSPSLLYDVALSLEKQRRWRAAADTYEAYLHDAGPRAKNPRRLEKRIAELRVRATRQEELESVARPAVRDQGAPNEAGNEVMPFESGEGRLLDLSGEEMPAVPGTEAARGGAGSSSSSSPSSSPGEKKLKPWVWGVIGAGVAVLAGVGVGVGIGVSRARPAPTTYPEVGPGLESAVLLRF